METVKSLIEYHKMIPHPEGGHYVERVKEDSSFKVEEQVTPLDLYYLY